MRKDLVRHLDRYAEKTPNGLLFVGERGKPFRRSTFGRKWRKARTKVGLPEEFRFYDLRHTGHTLSTPPRVQADRQRAAAEAAGRQSGTERARDT